MTGLIAGKPAPTDGLWVTSLLTRLSLHHVSDH